MSVPHDRIPTPAWNAWGSGEDASPLDESLRALLEEGLGVPRRDTPPVDESEVRLRESELPAEVRSELAGIVGASRVRTDDHTRLRHAGGKSTPDLLRRRSGEAEVADAVVFPGEHAEVENVLRCCSRHGIAVTAFGGGTSVVGGVEPLRGGFAAVVTLDLARLDGLLRLDTESGTATLQAGLRGPEAEELLGAHGYSLGHFPQSFEYATIGGFAATRSSGQASAGYGRFDDMVVDLRAATPRGTLGPGRAPASAAGPDLRQLLLGSEGTFGVITEVTVRIHPVPAEKHHEAWSFPDFGAGSAALRELARTGALPTVARLSDEVETGLNLSSEEVGGPAASDGCLLVTTYEGSAEHVAARHSEAAELLRAAGGASLGPEPAISWERGRFHAPHLRDALLDVNALAETLETATSWANLHATHAAVRDALTESLTEQGTPPLVMCHVSHVYPTGASLYFTVACARGREPVEQWRRAKRAAAEAIAAVGATITHHHAVGLDHREWMTAEVGDLGVEVLRAVKSAVDPEGVLNPGKLVPPE
ncbi:FAD-binding oxidoreductase [Actinopolyspora saharensis]|uniref:Alkyldihydroxyacetonephosphate synthase n=1 Tax=Actinopolyspora saharensis TaxID=995062 RepID=A0A1H1GU49_9ACTN|nr:FAD-binding oxidoreductase [Actinopolyspora saharensis]SDR16752.1 alkyldihydroxyacetonephosphate synthase [Actinopolyspora saharensis]